MQVPLRHMSLGVTGKYRLRREFKGLFSRKERLVLQVEYSIGVWHPLDVGDNLKIIRKYTKWRDAEIIDTLPHTLAK